MAVVRMEESTMWGSDRNGAVREGPSRAWLPRSQSRADGLLGCAGWDGSVRWRDGERLEQLFEERCDRMRARGTGDRLAVDAADVALTYPQLDARANQLARFLMAEGYGPATGSGCCSTRRWTPMSGCWPCSRHTPRTYRWMPDSRRIV
ncbi:hypothetical protein SVIO_023190 [Streptomyces violaceusniger]|uniref:AMP-dependent synthetase/ligase domain-containing protein n=1 Tax=Streptomyces violaceusniger TaxID=68280 RepID=A0A4D4KXW9_STRVO|nr:hypothetical protein SVIO_023190 [Streptomyces violaceusniger]